MALEERAQRARAEVVEVLGRLAVKPVAAHEPAQPAAVVRRVERDQPARTEHPADLVERAAWVAQVLDRVVENDDVEVIARQIRGREIAAPNVEATEVALCGGERRHVDADRVPTARRGRFDEHASRAADVEEASAPADAPLDLGQAPHDEPLEEPALAQVVGIPERRRIQVPVVPLIPVQRDQFRRRRPRRHVGEPTLPAAHDGEPMLRQHRRRIIGTAEIAGNVLGRNHHHEPQQELEPAMTIGSRSRRAVHSRK